MANGNFSYSTRLFFFVLYFKSNRVICATVLRDLDATILCWQIALTYSRLLLFCRLSDIAIHYTKSRSAKTPNIRIKIYVSNEESIFACRYAYVFADLHIVYADQCRIDGRVTIVRNWEKDLLRFGELRRCNPSLRRPTFPITKPSFNLHPIAELQINKSSRFFPLLCSFQFTVFDISKLSSYLFPRFLYFIFTLQKLFVRIFNKK